MGSKEVGLEESVPIVDVSEILASSSSEVDLSSVSAKKIVKEVRNACLNWGFFYLVGHGVDPLLLEELRSVSKDFFHRPLEYKKSVQRKPNNYRGYTDYELTKQRKDWKEAFDYGTDIKNEATTIKETFSKIELDTGENQWPEGMDHFRDVLTKYYSTLHSLSSFLMDLIFMSLEVNPVLLRHHFSESKDTSFCRLNYYPPCPDATSTLGVGPHSDAGVLTVLLQDERVPSLQVEKDGRFHTVRPIPDSFVINIGDMMQIWSNGLYKAPVHRVLANSIKERFSVPFFLNPAYESNVEPLESCISNERPLRYQDKDVVLIVDETMDLKNRKIINCLVAPVGIHSKFRLLNTEAVEKCNSEEVVQFILRSIQNADIPIGNLIALVSDNANYMTAAGKTLRQISSRILHTTCWAHIIHLVAEEVRGAFAVADSFISKVKACLVKAPSRRNHLLSLLEKHNLEKKLPPVPVITRWTTWLQTGDYHFNNFVAIKDWIQEAELDSAAMGQLKKLIDDEILAEELSEISQIYPGMSTAIKTLEKIDGAASDVMFAIETVRGLLQLSNKLDQALDKLDKYLNGKHPAASFWTEVEFCDPRKKYKFQPNVLPDELLRFSKASVPISELVSYSNICSGFVAEKNFCSQFFWNNYEREMPFLSKLCLSALSIPPSSADVERSFSSLNRLLQPQRSSLTLENLNVHLRIQFNQRHVDDNAGEIVTDAEDDE